MMNRKGFTLIELLIVVVIIGILAAIAIPKFAATKDKAKLASVKTDIRNYMTAQEGYFSDFALYGSYAQLGANQGFRLSSGNSGAGAGTAGGYNIVVTNSSIASTPNNCQVAVGTVATVTNDGVIQCP
ncbi:MAG: prepilin-type N-terminal cleavage/methylation domain-containing protein [Gemmatimonadales bacterium]